MNVVEVFQGQKFTDVGSLQCVGKVASLCHEETNIQRIIEICRRTRKDEKQERFPRFGAHRFPRTRLRVIKGTHCNLPRPESPNPKKYVSLFVQKTTKSAFACPCGGQGTPTVTKCPLYQPYADLGLRSVGTPRISIGPALSQALSLSLSLSRARQATKSVSNFESLNFGPDVGQLFPSHEPLVTLRPACSSSRCWPLR